MFLDEHYRAQTILFALLIGTAFNFRAEDKKRRVRSTPVWLFFEMVALLLAAVLIAMSGFITA